MDKHILKKLLKRQFYLDNRQLLKPELFEDDSSDIYEVIVSCHEKFEQDLTLGEILAIWRVDNPTATKAERMSVEQALKIIHETEEPSDGIAKLVIEKLWRREFGTNVSKIGLNIAEGREQSVGKLEKLLERSKNAFLPDADVMARITNDIRELIKVVDKSNMYRFNINSLSEAVYGMRNGDFGIVFATPETGKTAFCVSLSCGPAGFCAQGLKVLYIGNEEDPKKTKLRAIQCWTGLTEEEIIDDPDKATAIYDEIKDLFVVKQAEDWDIEKVDAAIRYEQPHVTFIDQADKIDINGSWDGQNHARLRELYIDLRSTARKRNTALFAVSQASNDASGRTILTPHMMEGSKIGKFAEADIIFGIGKENEADTGHDDPLRFIFIGKNKISGVHTTITCKLNNKLSRYED